MKIRTKRYAAVVTTVTSLAAFTFAGPGVTPAGADWTSTLTWTASGPCGSLQTLTAPIGARSAVIKITGGGGGKGVGQGGGEGGWGSGGTTVTATVTVDSGQKLAVVIGCGGENGKGQNNNWNQRSVGGAGWSSGGAGLPGEVVAGVAGSTGGGGGGSSAVCIGTTCTTASSPRILVVAGGGGGGGTSNCATERAGTGGAIGSATASDATGYGRDGGNGMPGGANSSQALGGSNGRFDWGADGQDSIQRHGGWAISAAAGGGGGGRKGGRGGLGTWAPPTCQGASGGGGGSSWVRGDATAVSWQGGRFGAPAKGSATITFALCGADIRPFGDAGALVNQQYRDFKGRDANVLERVAAAIPIAECRTTADAYIAGFLPTSQTTVDAQLVRMYYAYFKRAPDQGGFEYWSDRITRLRARLDAVSQFFATSPEFIDTYGALDNGGFVDLVYQNVLGRAPDAGGRAFWVDQLNRRLRNRGAVMTGFAESTEFRTNMTPRVDGFRIWRAMIRTFPTTGQMDTVALPRLVTPSLPMSASVKVARLHSRYAARF